MADIEPIDDFSLLHSTEPLKSQEPFRAVAEKVFGGESPALAALRARHPDIHFAVGQAVDTGNTDALRALGKNNVTIDPAMMTQMTQSPELGHKYEKELDELMHSFETLFREINQEDIALSAFGTFLAAEGAFHSWGVTDPFTDSFSMFSLFDRNVMEAMTHLEEKREADELQAEKDFVQAEQELEKLEEELGHTHETGNPYIQNKAQADTYAREFSVGMEEAKHKLNQSE